MVLGQDISPALLISKKTMSETTTVYILTAIISIIVGILLVYQARLSSHAAIKNSHKSMGEPLADNHLDHKVVINKIVSDEIDGLVDSRKSREVISQRLTEAFDKTLSNAVIAKTGELQKKYEAILSVEKQSEDIACKKYKKVLEEKTETDAVIRSIAEGLVVVDGKGKVLMMNPAAERLLGISKSDKVGRSILEGLRDEQLVSLIKSDSGNTDKEIELTSHQDETKKVLRASTAVVENESGQTVGMVSVLSDITRQKEIERMKSDFVANVSHELRTPLVAIDKSIALLLSGEADKLSATQEQFLTLAQRNLKRLTALINDLLDLAKLEQKKMDLKIETLAIDTVVSDCVDTLNSWAKGKSITLKKDIQAGLPALNIDPSRITQVVTNLIGNAIKFTPNGGSITIGARLSAQSEALEVSVVDTGIGISKEDIPKIFDKFYQAGERISTDISGTGIGLTISKEIVELHGGKIWVESEKSAGTKFIFTLPIK
jgi:PAS domain S-box-containing protein